MHGYFWKSLAIGALAVGLLGGCGDGDGGTTATTPTPAPPPPPPTPASASIEVEIISATFAASGEGNALQFEVRITESAGLGANINFIRVDLFAATGAFEERQEIGSGQIIAQTGSNRIEANQTRELTIVFGFRATVKSGRQVLFTIGLTDDKGNNLDVAEAFVFPLRRN